MYKSTIAANGMQRLLVHQEDEIGRLKLECAEAQSAKDKSDKLVTDALRKELTLERELETLRGQTAEMIELKSQLLEARCTNQNLQTEVDRLKTQVADLTASSAKVSKELATTQGKLFWSEDVRHFLMKSGIKEIVDKIRASHEFGYQVARLAPDLQALARTNLI